MAVHAEYPVVETEVVRIAFYPLVMQFPIVCYTLTLFTDIAYWSTEFLMWQNFSSWLLLAGNATAVITGIVALIEYFSGRLGNSIGWPLLLGAICAFVISIFNSFVHSGDGWTAVVPWGITLSMATVFVMLATVGARWWLWPTNRVVVRRTGERRV